MTTGLCKRTWEIDAHQGTGVYETQEDHLTDGDDVLIPFNDKCISLEKIHINTKKLLVYVEQKVDETAS